MYTTNMRALKAMSEKYQVEGKTGKSLIIVSVNGWKHLNEIRLINVFQNFSMIQSDAELFCNLTQCTY
jgi:DNA-binding protein YbaB